MGFEEIHIGLYWKQVIDFYKINKLAKSKNRFLIKSIYIKDKTFLEDDWKVKTKNAPANYSIIRNLAINIFRHRGYECIQAAIEKCANNVEFMMGLL